MRAAAPFFFFSTTQHVSICHHVRSRKATTLEIQTQITAFIYSPINNKFKYCYIKQRVSDFFPRYEEP